MDREKGAASGPQASGAVTAAEAGLIQQLQQGDPAAGYQFMRDYYPGVYRYLLFLIGRPETAEDLAQETFLQAWRRLDRFEGRAPLRVWLHRIARHEFLQELRGRQPLTSLEEIAEPSMPAASSHSEAEIIDERLTRKLTLAAKGMALADLCEQLRTDTGIQIAAGPSVADEKVTLFCEKLPLREVMRQLSRPFGYTWLRSGTSSKYRYELVQDLRSQLLEEELRNRDRNMALLVLEREIERYRPYLALSPDEALERAKNAPPEQKNLLEKLAGVGWRAMQMYFRLTAQDLADLRSGQELNFMSEPGPGADPDPDFLLQDLARAAPRALPQDLAHGVLQSMTVSLGYRLRRMPGVGLISTRNPADSTAIPLTAVPETRAWVKLRLVQSESGQFRLIGASRFIVPLSNSISHDELLAVGAQAAGLQPENAVLNARWARDPALERHVTAEPWVEHGLSAAGSRPSVTAGLSLPTVGSPEPTAHKVTTADVLEALHHASGLPIVADFYTRLYDPAAVSLQNQPLFAALNHLADRMRLRWSKDAGAHEAGLWLELHSMSFYDDRLKEVPNRLLTRWAASRQEHAMLTLDDLCEIAPLPDTQLDGDEMAEGARDLWGLKEWHLARGKLLRLHLRFLASLTPDQRQATLRPEGLAFEQMSLSQQQRYFALGEAGSSEPTPLQSLEELAGGVLRVEYTQPGWFEWRVPGLPYFQWTIPVGSGPEVRRAPRRQIRERTPEAALATARRLYPQGFEVEVQAARQLDARFEAAAMVPQPEQIVPTDLDLTVIYILGASIRNVGRGVRWISVADNNAWGGTYLSRDTYWPVHLLPPPP